MRQLNKDDWPFMLSCLREVARDSPNYAFGDFSADNIDRTRQYYKAGMDANALFGVIEPDKGFMFGALSIPWYDGKRIDAFEQLLYVRQPYRGGMLAGKLIKAWEAEAVSRGAIRAFAGSTIGTHDETVIRLYQKLGWSISNQSVEKILNVHSGT